MGLIIEVWIEPVTAQVMMTLPRSGFFFLPSSPPSHNGRVCARGGCDFFRRNADPEIAADHLHDDQCLENSRSCGGLAMMPASQEQNTMAGPIRMPTDLVRGHPRFH